MMPWTTPVKFSLLIFIFLTPSVVWWVSLIDPSIYFEHTVPEGQRQYVLSKLLGLYAVFLMWLQVIVALIKEHKPNQYVPRFTPKIHVILGVSTILLVMAHMGLFIYGVYLRTDHAPIHLLAPDFQTGFYNGALGIGAIALWLLCIVGISGRMRSISRRTVWKLLHKLSLVVFFLGFLHGFLVGTESKFSLMFYFYTGMAGALMGLVLYRLYQHIQLGKSKRFSATKVSGI